MRPHEILSEFLLTLPNVGSLSHRSHILLVAYHLRSVGQTHFSTAELSRAFSEGGLPIPASLGKRLRNLIKGKTAPLVRAERQSYSLSVIGVQEVQRYLQTVYGLAAARASLEKMADKLADDSDRQFLAEAIACVDLGAKRATVVMVWLLTVDHLHRFILAHRLADFNQALSARNDHRGLAIKTKDDFSEIRDDRAFIEILRSARIITRDVQRILDENLGFRNSCAHPAAIIIPDNKVVAAVEDLSENVILKYLL